VAENTVQVCRTVKSSRPTNFVSRGMSWFPPSWHFRRDLVIQIFCIIFIFVCELLTRRRQNGYASRSGARGGACCCRCRFISYLTMRIPMFNMHAWTQLQQTKYPRSHNTRAKDPRLPLLIMRARLTRQILDAAVARIWIPKSGSRLFEKNFRLVFNF
jgi:hypothetical protein